MKIAEFADTVEGCSFNEESMSHLLSSRRKEIIVKVGVCLQKIGFYTSRRFNCHLGAILKNKYWEFITGHTG